MSNPITDVLPSQDYLALSNIAFEWADSYDTKDWVRLEAILAPTLHIDYTAALGPGNVWNSMPAAELVQWMSSVDKLGNPLIATQHFIGGSKWEKVSEHEVRGIHQLRAAHQRYKSGENVGTHGEVAVKGHGHVVVHHLYRRGSDSGWKLAEIKAVMYFDEFSVAEVFGGV